MFGGQGDGQDREATRVPWEPWAVSNPAVATSLVPWPGRVWHPQPWAQLCHQPHMGPERPCWDGQREEPFLSPTLLPGCGAVTISLPVTHPSLPSRLLPHPSLPSRLLQPRSAPPACPCTARDSRPAGPASSPASGRPGRMKVREDCGCPQAAPAHQHSPRGLSRRDDSGDCPLSCEALQK